jgi:predicted regulator of Ras-like GTPase activity (Roadblock/LC7/MglB family)
MKRRRWTPEQIGSAAPSVEEFSEAVSKISEFCAAALRGQHPGIQGAVVADLLGMFLGGHHPDNREEALAQITTTARAIAIEHGKHIGWDKELNS